MANIATHTNYISQVKLPGSEIIYDIHDAAAIHDQDLISAIIFKGTDTEANILAKTGELGDVWHAYDTGNEWLYVGTENNFGSNDPWQELGNPLVSDHKHQVSITGVNKASQVTGTTTVPTVDTADIYTKASATAPGVTAPTDTFVKSYPGVTETLTKANITPPGGEVNIKGVDTVSTTKLETIALKGVRGEETVIKSVTPKTANTGSINITGVSGSVDASLVTKTTKKMATTSINPVSGTVDVIDTVTPTVEITPSATIRGVSGTTSVINGVDFTTKKLEQTTLRGVSGETNVLNKVSNTSVTSAAQNANASNWSFTVTDNVLTIGGGNGTTFAASTLPANTNVVTGVSSESIAVATANEAATTLATGVATTSGTGDALVDSVSSESTTVATANATESTFATPSEVVTAVSTDTASVATIGQAVTVATGSLATDGAGATVVDSVSISNVVVPVASTEVAVAKPMSGIMTGIDTETESVALADTTASTVATGATSATGTGSSLVSGVSTKEIAVATPGTEMAVLTGLGAAGEVGDVMTGLGTPTTATAVTGVTVAAPSVVLSAGSSADGFKTGEDITVGSTVVAVSGTAAAQEWTQSPSPADTTGPIGLN